MIYETPEEIQSRINFLKPRLLVTGDNYHRVLFCDHCQADKRHTLMTSASDGTIAAYVCPVCQSERDKTSWAVES